MSASLGWLRLKAVVAEKSGFCYGVQRAFSMALEVAESGGRAYTLGPLIHNAAVVDMLERRGLVSLRDESQLGFVTEGTVVIRSHGVSRSTIEQALARGLAVVDATCPYVRRAHDAARDLVAEGYELIIVGDEGHPEVVGILGTIEAKGRVVASPAELGEVQPARYAVIAQTTQTREAVRNVVDALLDASKEVRVVNTICTATVERQEGVRRIATQVDVMLVVGDASSANTNRLAEISTECGVRTHLVQNASELDQRWFFPGAKVGVTAGASTPSYIIEEVLARMQSSNGDDNRDSDAQSGVEAIESMEEAEGFVVSLRPLSVGDMVQATVVSISQDAILVDVGHKSEGVIPLTELTLRSVAHASDVVAIGDTFTAKVTDISEKDDGVTLSRRQADEEGVWVGLKSASEAGSRVSGTVIAEVKGGLTVDVGVRGFLPASQVERSFVADFSSYVGHEYQFLVTEIDEARRNVILSRRKVLEEDYATAKAAAYERFEAGQVVEGEVKRLMDFGAFVDIFGGVEGLLHLSEMSWERPRHPSDILKVGDKIRVVILAVDSEKERISLGLKQTLENPWSHAAEKYPVGAIVTGTVGNLAAFGAFVKLEGGIEGLIHISQLSHSRVTSPAQVVLPGQEVTVKVVSFDEATRRIGLSIKELTAPEPSSGLSAESGGGLRNYSTDADAAPVTIGDLLRNSLRQGGRK